MGEFNHITFLCSCCFSPVSLQMRGRVICTRVICTRVSDPKLHVYSSGFCGNCSSWAEGEEFSAGASLNAPSPRRVCARVGQKPWCRCARWPAAPGEMWEWWLWWTSGCQGGCFARRGRRNGRRPSPAGSPSLTRWRTWRHTGDTSQLGVTWSGLGSKSFAFERLSKQVMLFYRGKSIAAQSFLIQLNPSSLTEANQPIIPEDLPAGRPFRINDPSQCSPLSSCSVSLNAG